MWYGIVWESTIAFYCLRIINFQTFWFVVITCLEFTMQADWPRFAITSRVITWTGIWAVIFNAKIKTFVWKTIIDVTSGLRRTSSFLVVPHGKRARNDQEQARSTEACVTYIRRMAFWSYCLNSDYLCPIYKPSTIVKWRTFSFFQWSPKIKLLSNNYSIEYFVWQVTVSSTRFWN